MTEVMHSAVTVAGILAAALAAFLIVCGWVLIEDARDESDGPHAD
jgi:hypothetical protein